MGLPLTLAELALSRLLKQWRRGSGSGNIRNVLLGLSDAAQELADEVLALIVDRSLLTATGAQLDQYGRLVTEPRLGRDDATYRTAIIARIATNRSSGTPEELIAILLGAAQTDRVRLVEYPVGVHLEYERPTPTSPEQRAVIADQIQKAAPAGVPVVAIEAVTGFFGFAGNPKARGFGVGKMATILRET